MGVEQNTGTNEPKPRGRRNILIPDGMDPITKELVLKLAEVSFAVAEEARSVFRQQQKQGEKPPARTG